MIPHSTACKVRLSKSSRCQRTGRPSSERSKPSNRSSVRNRTTTVAIRSSTSDCAVSHGRTNRSPFATRSLRSRRVSALSSAYRRITKFRSLPTSHDVNILSTDNVFPLGNRFPVSLLFILIRIPRSDTCRSSSSITPNAPKCAQETRKSQAPVVGCSKETAKWFQAQILSLRSDAQSSVGH